MWIVRPDRTQRLRIVMAQQLSTIGISHVPSKVHKFSKEFTAYGCIQVGGLVPPVTPIVSEKVRRPFLP
jgi:hypothetical protein